MVVASKGRFVTFLILLSVLLCGVLWLNFLLCVAVGECEITDMSYHMVNAGWALLIGGVLLLALRIYWDTRMLKKD